MLRAPAWALLCLLAASDGLLACDTGCDKENEEALVYDAALPHEACTTYQTGGFDEPYLEFPAGRRWRISHGLHQVPSEVHSYLAFVADALPQGENGNTAESAGNQVIIEAMTDEFIQVRNDTCEENFHLRLVAEVPVAHADCLAAVSPADTGAAGGGGG